MLRGQASEQTPVADIPAVSPCPSRKFPSCHSRRLPSCPSRKFPPVIPVSLPSCHSRKSPLLSFPQVSPPVIPASSPPVIPASSPPVIPASLLSCHSRKSPLLSFPQAPLLSFPQVLSGNPASFPFSHKGRKWSTPRPDPMPGRTLQSPGFPLKTGGNDGTSCRRCQDAPRWIPTPRRTFPPLSPRIIPLPLPAEADGDTGRGHLAGLLGLFTLNAQIQGCGFTYQVQHLVDKHFRRRGIA